MISRVTVEELTGQTDIGSASANWTLRNISNHRRERRYKKSVLIRRWQLKWGKIVQVRSLP